MKVDQLALKMALKDGHKSKAKIKDFKDMLLILSDLSYESADPLICVRQLGIARAKRKKSKT